MTPNEATELPPAINNALSNAAAPTRTYTLKVHKNVSELFEILKDDLESVTKTSLSRSNVLKHLVLFWFDMVNEHSSDRECLAYYMNRIMEKNRRAVMAKDYKHFNPESSAVKTHSQTAPQVND